MASRTPDQIVSDQLAKLKITIPGMSFEVGAPERKILDTFAESISEVQIDNYITSTLLDIDTKSGTDLDDLVGFFGYGRLQGNYATGIITFNSTTPATQPIYIPAGVQASRPASSSDPALLFSTTVPATIATGSSIASIPAQCTVVGTIGNVSANSISVFSAATGITTVNNPVAFTGGTDDESDEALRARFKKTFLRNIAGTEDYYTGIALQASGVSRVKVLGPVNTYSTQIQTQAIGAPVTLVSRSCKYVWSQGIAVAVNKDSTDPANPETWFTQDVDYSFAPSTGGATNAPIITPLNSNTANKFLDISYEYNSSNSRNDPVNGKTNKIDIFVDGVSALQVTEKIVIKSITLNSTPSSQYYVGNFASSPGGTTLTAGSSKFQRLGSTPILTWPLTIASNVLGVNYVGVYDTSTNNGSERETAGIVWLTPPPVDGSLATVTYNYNQTPQVLNAILKRSKQVTTDVLVRAAITKFLSFYFVIMYNSGVSVSTVNAAALAAVQAYVASLGFGAWVQLSDIATVIHNVSGVDNCRYAKVSDGAPYTVSEMVGGVSTGVVYTSDFQIPDNTIPALDSLYFIRRSFNSFGS